MPHGAGSNRGSLAKQNSGNRNDSHSFGRQFEIKVDGVVRSHRDFRESAIEAARFLQQRIPGAKIAITDLRDGSVVSFDRSA